MIEIHFTGSDTEELATELRAVAIAFTAAFCPDDFMANTDDAQPHNSGATAGSVTTGPVEGIASATAESAEAPPPALPSAVHVAVPAAPAATTVAVTPVVQSAAMPGAPAIDPIATAAATIGSATVAPTVKVIVTPAVGPAVTMPAKVAIVGASAAVTLDGEGLPHDPRIHSKVPTLKADGKWRTKRGIATTAPGLLESVTAELRLKYPIPGVLPGPGGVPQLGNTPTSAPVTGAAAAPVVPVATATPEATVNLTDIVSIASAILAHGADAATLQVSAAKMTAALVGIGLPPDHNTNDLIARPALYPAAMTALQGVATEIGLEMPVPVVAGAIPVA